MAPTTTTKKIFGFMLVITAFTVLLGFCSATTYKVGDSDGWTAKDDKYHGWAENKEFNVGDSLLFEYDHDFNDVVPVIRLDYDLCQSSFAEAVYKTGHDVVTLTKPGHHYFISSNPARCRSGQKLDVHVLGEELLEFKLNPMTESLHSPWKSQVTVSSGSSNQEPMDRLTMWLRKFNRFGWGLA
ncbi:unnamed protein product [Microthlaspi erraticum]|uniref:Phytocyanin domain-containing protein n=1 Tax=Microthlaspi erraticum TaxID=1685480 RepID=A0A6D2JF38_9BRAS|nr:unnamed protein product [Microthlaspi erraticum]